MKLIEEYIKERHKINFNEVSLGYTTVHLYEAKELDAGQIGYSVDSNGNPLYGSEVGDWQSSWLVIAYEDCCGDPFFIDLDDSNYPVYTAMHGEEIWDPEMIASTFENFIKALILIRGISEGRDNPVKLEQNPISQEEREKTLKEIQRIDEEMDIKFWDNWISD